MSVLKLRQPDALKLAGFPESIHNSFNSNNKTSTGYLSTSMGDGGYLNNHSPKKLSARKQKKYDKNTPAVWVIIDLVDANGKAYNDLWRHRTERRDAAARQLIDTDSVEEGKPGISVSDIDFGGEARVCVCFLTPIILIYTPCSLSLTLFWYNCMVFFLFLYAYSLIACFFNCICAFC